VGCVGYCGVVVGAASRAVCANNHIQIVHASITHVSRYQGILTHNIQSHKLLFK
jgi:hypothetical protein